MAALGLRTSSSRVCVGNRSQEWLRPEMAAMGLHMCTSSSRECVGNRSQEWLRPEMAATGLRMRTSSSRECVEQERLRPGMAPWACTCTPTAAESVWGTGARSG
ncbi:hypothetical protein NDU88_011197 [Pleurodeles waltl]|uniref:Uncharacterized protein n=1 Tax=Pleurodeles waltl TaxID=8319 RepID=A0AAV7Q028_PLEWA|nr:hypothetical protein NDU88_011197 [Pleurodeles waltl]